MMLTRSCRLFFLVLVLAAASSAVAQPQRPGSSGPPWWKDEQFKKDLGLTADQSGRIDAIFQSTLPQLRQGYDELDRAENKLSHLIETNADEAAVLKQIDRVETTRSSLNKTRTLMHLHMRQVLTAEQRVRFTALYEKRQADQQQRRPQAPRRSER